MSESEAVYLTKTRDAYAMLLDATQERLEALAVKTGKVDNMPDMSQVIWRETIGPHGKYELAEKTSNTENPGFRILAEYLRAHQNKVTIEGYFLWVFDNGDIGRKPKT